MTLRAERSDRSCQICLQATREIRVQTKTNLRQEPQAEAQVRRQVRQEVQVSNLQEVRLQEHQMLQVRAKTNNSEELLAQTEVWSQIRVYRQDLRTQSLSEEKCLQTCSEVRLQVQAR